MPGLAILFLVLAALLLLDVAAVCLGADTRDLDPRPATPTEDF
ncbi:MAG: hypothetical protein ACYDAK_02395 [Candidatus Limnocylindrales bacterium]